MAFCKTRKKRRIDHVCQVMRDAKERNRIDRAGELGETQPAILIPNLRRIVIVIDFDFGAKVDVFRLFKTSRIDSYRAQHGSKEAGSVGWANFCKRLSTHYPRVMSLASLD